MESLYVCNLRSEMTLFLVRICSGFYLPRLPVSFLCVYACAKAKRPNNVFYFNFEKLPYRPSSQGTQDRTVYNEITIVSGCLYKSTDVAGQPCVFTDLPCSGVKNMLFFYGEGGVGQGLPHPALVTFHHFKQTSGSKAGLGEDFSGTRGAVK